jgi:hypothetical protein
MTDHHPSNTEMPAAVPARVPTAAPATPPPRHEICGAIHLHTHYSDGGVDYPELIHAAREVGLDYLVVTDHMTVEGRTAGFGGFHQGVFVEIGYEHNDRNLHNHYLVTGTSGVVDGQTAAEYVAAVRAQGGVGFLAHPHEVRHYFSTFPPYPWTDWHVTGFDGVELWNQMSDWMENLRSWRSMVRVWFPRRFMADVPRALMRRWDELNRLSFVSAIGGVDAHTRKYGLGLMSFTVFPIKVELKGIRTHVYIDRPLPQDDPVRAGRILREALRDGHGFFSNFRRGNARGAELSIRYGDGAVLAPGRAGEPHPLPATISVKVPLEGRIRLMRNGVRVDKRTGTAAEFIVDAPGVYRIEVRRRRKAWIYSNPFPVGTYPL